MIRNLIFLPFLLANPAFGHLPSHRPPVGLIKTQSQALHSAFPAGFTRRTVFLKPEQTARAEALNGAKLPSAMVVAYRDVGKEGHCALFERVVVGERSVTVVVLISSDGTLAESRVLAADFPADFLPPEPWLAAMTGLRANELSWTSQGLSRHHEARAAAEAIMASIRRSLAVFDAALKSE